MYLVDPEIEGGRLNCDVRIHSTKACFALKNAGSQLRPASSTAGTLGVMPRFVNHGFRHFVLKADDVDWDSLMCTFRTTSLISPDQCLALKLPPDDFDQGIPIMSTKGNIKQNVFGNISSSMWFKEGAGEPTKMSICNGYGVVVIGADIAPRVPTTRAEYSAGNDTPAFKIPYALHTRDKAQDVMESACRVWSDSYPDGSGDWEMQYRMGAKGLVGTSVRVPLLDLYRPPTYLK